MSFNVVWLPLFLLQFCIFQISFEDHQMKIALSSFKLWFPVQGKVGGINGNWDCFWSSNVIPLIEKYLSWKCNIPFKKCHWSCAVRQWFCGLFPWHFCSTWKQNEKRKTKAERKNYRQWHTLKVTQEPHQPKPSVSLLEHKHILQVQQLSKWDIVNQVSGEAIKYTSVKHDCCFLNRRSESPHVKAQSDSEWQFRLCGDQRNCKQMGQGTRESENTDVQSCFHPFYFANVTELMALWSHACVRARTEEAERSAVHWQAGDLNHYILYSQSCRIQEPQPTITIWKAKGGMREYKLCLFRLIVADVCCLVFPLSG